MSRKIKIGYVVINILGMGGVLLKSTYDSYVSHEFPCGPIPNPIEMSKLENWRVATLTIAMIVIGLTLLFGTTTFIHLFMLMSKRHKLEFKRVKNTMLIIFSVMTALFTTVTYEVVNDYQPGDQFNYSIWLTEIPKLDN